MPSRIFSAVCAGLFVLLTAYGPHVLAQDNADRHLRLSLNVNDDGSSTLTVRRMPHGFDTAANGRNCWREPTQDGIAQYQYVFSDPDALHYLSSPVNALKPLNASVNKKASVLEMRPAAVQGSSSPRAAVSLPYRLVAPFQVDYDLTLPQQPKGNGRLVFLLYPFHYELPNNEPATVNVVVNTSDSLSAAEVEVVNGFPPASAMQPQRVTQQPLRWGGDKAVVHFATPLPKGAIRKAFTVSFIVSGDMVCDMSHVAVRGAIQLLLGCRFDGQGDNIYALDVFEGGAAHNAGVQNGDRIASINETKVRSLSDLYGALATVDIGADVACVVDRDGSEVRLTINIPENLVPPKRAPATQSRTSEHVDASAKEVLGEKSYERQAVSPTTEKPGKGTPEAKPGLGQQAASAGRQLRLPDDAIGGDALLTQILKGTQSGVIEKIVFSPDGASLAASNDSGFVFVWDTRSGKERLCVKQFFDAGCRHICEVGFSADNKSLIVAGETSIVVIDAFTGETRASTKLKATFVAAKISPDGAWMAIGDVNKEVRLLPLANLEAIQTLGSFPYSVAVFAFSPDSSRLACSFGDWYPDSVKVFECKSGKLMWESESINVPIKTLAFTRDSKTVLASSGGYLGFLDAQTGKSMPLGHEKVAGLEVRGPFSEIETTLDGTIAVLAKSDRAGFTIVDLRQPRVVERTTGDSRKLESNEESLAIGQQTGFLVETRRARWHELFVRVYSPESRAVVLEMPLPNLQERGIAVSPDCTKCAVRQEYEVALVRLSVAQRQQERQAEVARGVAQRQAAEDAKRMAEEADRLAAEAALQQRIADEKARVENLRRRNATPEWAARPNLDLGNLNDEVERSGLAFEQFVRFGTAAVAQKAAGDRFDRMEAKKDAGEHASKLQRTSYLWTTSAFRCSDEDVPSDDPQVVKQIIWVDVPFRVVDLAPSLGPNVSVWDSADRNGLWFLTKEQKLAPVESVPALNAVRQNNGFVYVPDTDTSQVRISVSGPLEDIKSLVRSNKNHIVQFQVEQLGVNKPIHWGFYQERAALEFRWHAPAMRLFDIKKDASGGGDESEPPVYFRTKMDPDTPELIVGLIARVEVARIDGEARKVIFTAAAEGVESR